MLSGMPGHRNELAGMTVFIAVGKGNLQIVTTGAKCRYTFCLESDFGPYFMGVCDGFLVPMSRLGPRFLVRV